MRNKSLHIVFVFLLGCGASSKSSPNKELKSTFIEASDECIEAIRSKEDELLGNFKKLQNYKWNPDKLTATIIISENKTLEIRLTGCDEVLKECQFVVPSSFKLEKEYNEVKQDILWVTELIANETLFIQIKNLLTDSNIESWKITDNENPKFLIPFNFNENQQETVLPIIAVFEKGLNNNSYKITYLAN